MFDHGKNPEDLFVRVGDTSLGTTFEATAFTVNVKNIILHPDYSSWPKYENDIAVLELATPVLLYDYPNIKPACLPDAGAKFPGAAIVSGWGKVAPGSNIWAWLLEAPVRVFEEGNCGNYTLDEITNDKLCAGGLHVGLHGQRDACHGDNGGPLIASDPTKYNAQTLIGVTSWRKECGRKDYPGLYTEVSQYTSWLEQQMPDLVTCEPYDDPDFSNVSCRNCVFPFIYDNRIHDSCTTINNDPEPWCIC